MTVYIAGPLNSDNSEFLHMQRERKLKGFNYSVINPFQKIKKLYSSYPFKTLSKEEQTNICLSLLVSCDGISFLDDWEQFEELKIIHDVAVATGKTIVDAVTCNPRWGK